MRDIILIDNKRSECMTEKDYSSQLGRITNIDYQTDWILKELKRTNELIE